MFQINMFYLAQIASILPRNKFSHVKNLYHFMKEVQNSLILSLFLDPADEDEFDESEADGDVDAEAADLTATTRGMLE